MKFQFEATIPHPNFAIPQRLEFPPFPVGPPVTNASRRYHTQRPEQWQPIGSAASVACHGKQCKSPLL